MTKAAFDKIMAGVNSAVDVGEGRVDPATYRVHVPEKVDVGALRRRLNLTQVEFADRYGFSAAAVRDWEQGRKPPEKSNRYYLTVIERETGAVERALQA